MGSCISLVLDDSGDSTYDNRETFNQFPQSAGGYTDNANTPTAFSADNISNQANQQSTNIALDAYHANSQGVAPTWNVNGPQGPGYYGGF